jgi:hypothetical protein
LKTPVNKFCEFSDATLHIETGQYTRPITPVENRICSNCNSKSVEDEIHFLKYCPKFENHRRELFSNVLNYNAAILSAEDKFAWILSNEDPACDEREITVIGKDKI